MSRARLLLAVTLGEWGGAQAYVCALALALRDRYDLTVLCGPGAALPARLREAGVPVVQVGSLRRGVNPLRDGQAYAALLAHLRAGRYDLVHTNSTKMGLLGRLAAARAGAPVVVFTAHGWAFTEGRPMWVRRVLAAVERAAARHTTAIVCVCEHDRALARRFRVGRPEQVVVIPNGIDPTPFLAPGREAASGPPVIAMVGRLAPPKDPRTLLEACRVLPAARVVIAGDGSLVPSTARLARRLGLDGRVTLAGFTHDVPALLRGADIFVLPSRWEGLPLAVIEAMMAGLPVVASAVGGVGELVEDGVTGYLVPPGDAPALGRALRRLVEDPARRRRMGAAGQERAVARFTQARMVQETLDLYEALLNRSPTAPRVTSA